MFHPPSLPEAVLERSFRARNGELGLTRDDALAFLSACVADGIEVLGWEMWVIDHVWGFGGEPPAPVPGKWTGSIPTRSHQSTIQGGTGDYETTRSEIASFPLEEEIAPEFLEFIRFNITVAAPSC